MIWPLVVLVGHLLHPAHLAVDAKNVYWTEGNEVRRQEKAGKAPSTLAKLDHELLDMVLDGDALYLAVRHDDEGKIDLDRLSARGGKAERLAVLDIGTPRIVTDAAFVYCFGGGGAIVRVAKANGKTTKLADNVEYSYPTGLAVDDRWLYFANALDDAVRIYVVDKKGGEVRQLVGVKRQADNLVVSDGVLYYGDDDVVWRVVKDQPIKVVDGDLLAIGGDRIFFSHGDAVHALARKGTRAVKLFDGADGLVQAVFEPGSGTLWFVRDDRNSDEPKGEIGSFVP
jgi:hypothetical protein